jgi:hypothetical protein
VVVARGLHGDWVWDLWGRLEVPACLDLGEGATARGAMDDADRAAARVRRSNADRVEWH